MGQAILASLITGILLLIIEYRTGWFAERTSLPSLRSIIDQFINKASVHISRRTPLIKRRVRQIKISLGFIIPFLAISANIFLLFPESQTSPGLASVLILSLTLMAFLASKTIESPMNGVTAFLIFVSIVAAYVLLIRPSTFSESTWPTELSSEPDMTDIETVAMTIILTVLSVIWVTSNTMTTHIRKAQGELREKLELLYDAPEISSMLEAGERERLNRVIAEWQEFMKNLEVTDRRAAHLIRRCVPVKFDGYVLHIGCETARDVSNINNPVPISSGRQLPPPKLAIQNAMQEFFEKPHITILCKTIESYEYIEIRKRLDSLDTG